MVVANGIHHPRQNVADPDILQLQCPREDVFHDSINSPRESVFISARLWSARTLNHELASAISSTFANSAEQIEKVLQIRRSQGRTQATVQKYKMRPISTVDQVIDNVRKAFGRDAGENVSGIVELQRLMQGHGLALSKREEGPLEFFQAGNQEAVLGRWGDEVDEDVAGVEVDVNKVVDCQHCLYQERILISMNRNRATPQSPTKRQSNPVFARMLSARVASGLLRNLLSGIAVSNVSTMT